MPFSMSRAAKVASVSKTTIHKWVKTGKLSATKGSDGTYSIDESELDRVMSDRKLVMSPPVTTDVRPEDTSSGKQVLEKSIYTANTLNELKYAAALEAVTYERELLRKQVEELRQRAEAAEERSEAAHERYHESIKTMTRLLEDKREPQPRKRFLGIF
jgi:predicted site-specific integrase-resolvase